MSAMRRVLMIDNYDSFTYNVVQCLGTLGVDVHVVRNDKIDLAGLWALSPDYLVISPGPKAPADAGISLAAIKELGRCIPILGICLGHQCVNEAFGGRTIRAPKAIHGKTSRILSDGKGVFAGLPSSFLAARYHSLVADPTALGEGLEVTARTKDGVVMGLRHTCWPIEGVQFHPESFLTEYGMALFRNLFDRR